MHGVDGKMLPFSGNKFITFNFFLAENALDSVTFLFFADFEIHGVTGFISSDLSRSSDDPLAPIILRMPLNIPKKTKKNGFCSQFPV